MYCLLGWHFLLVLVIFIGKLIFAGNNTVIDYYEFKISDHLGSLAVTFKEENNHLTVLQRHFYYPFGMNQDGIMPLNTSTENRFQYNGKELEKDGGIDLSDYGARWYDAGIGRFTSVDPLVEKYSFQSPYAYATNNPVLFRDILGMGVEGDYFDKDGTYLGSDGIDDNKIYVKDDNGKFPIISPLEGKFSEITPDSELGTLARAVYAEAGNDNFEGKVVIAEVIRNRTLLSDHSYGFPEAGKTYSEVIYKKRGATSHQFQFLDNKRLEAFDNPSSKFDEYGEKAAFLSSVGASLKMHYGETNLAKGATFFRHYGSGIRSSKLESVTPPSGSNISSLQRFKNYKKLFNDTSYFD